MFKNNRGMTLIEMMIVVSIIGVLALIGSAYLRTQVYKGNDARRKAELKRISIAVEEYEKDKDCYPPPSLVTCSNGGTGLRPYIDNIPCDPVTKESYSYEDDTTACSKWYVLYADLQNENDVDFLPNIGPASAYSYYYASPNAPAVVPSNNPYGNDVYYGCFSGVCTAISGTACTPNYGASNCSTQCGTPQAPMNECTTN